VVDVKELAMSVCVNLSTLSDAASQANNAALDSLLGFDGLDASDMQNQIRISAADPLRASLGFYEVTINGKTGFMDREGIRDALARLRQPECSAADPHNQGSPSATESQVTCELLPVDQEDPSDVDDPMAGKNVDLQTIEGTSGRLTRFEQAIRDERYGEHSVVPGDPNGKTISTGPVFSTYGKAPPDLASARAVQCTDPSGTANFAWVTREGHGNVFWSRDGKLLDAQYDGSGYSMEPGFVASLLNPVDLLSGAVAAKLVAKPVSMAANALEAGIARAEVSAAANGAKALEKGAVAAARAESATVAAVADDIAAAGARSGINWNPFRAPSLERYMPNAGNVSVDGLTKKGNKVVDFLQLEANHGGRIFAATDEITGSHVDTLANELLSGSLSQGKDVVILTGRHGSTAGWDVGQRHFKFLMDDFVIAPAAKNLQVVDATRLTAEEMQAILQRGDDVILGWCNSENSRQVMKALGVNVMFAPF
jgi:hypothetical protein